MDTYLTYQLLFALSILLGTFFSYLLPIKLISRLSNFSQLDNEQNQSLLSYCNCLSAGIFVSICFLGLFPVVREEFDELFKQAAIGPVDYPVAELTILLGFFLVITLEQLVINLRSKPPPVLYLDDIQEQSHRLLEETSNSIANGISNFVPDHSSSDSTKTSEHISDENFSDHNHLQDNRNPPIHKFTSSHGHHHSHIPGDNLRSISFFMLFFATGVHSIFEGLALGLMKVPSKALHLYVGIILHECLVAIALGINSAKIPGNIRFGLLFSSTVPMGIIIGVLVGYAPGIVGKLISSIFQGLAAGTFIHVAFYELIPQELSESNSSGATKLFKIFILFLGFMIMAIIGFFTTDGH